jgi:hypothetical protein
VACAQAMGPIKFHLVDGKPQWESAPFSPSFRDSLYFIYLGNKQSSELEVNKFHEMKIPGKEAITKEITQLTREMIDCQNLSTFNKILSTHEDIIARALNYKKVKEERFSDYWGEVKSLGAWGGDFVLVTSDREPRETREYFDQKGYSTIIPFQEIVRTL